MTDYCFDLDCRYLWGVIISITREDTYRSHPEIGMAAHHMRCKHLLVPGIPIVVILDDAKSLSILFPDLSVFHHKVDPP